MTRILSIENPFQNIIFFGSALGIYNVFIDFKTVQLVSKRVLQILSCGCPTDVACHCWGCWRAPTPVWMDSAGLPAVGQLTIRMQASSCL